MNSINEVFPLVKENIRQLVSKNVYELWIETIKDNDVKMHNNAVSIEVANTFTKGVLENNKFTEKVAEGFQEILGFPVAVNLLSKDDEENSQILVYSNTNTNSNNNSNSNKINTTNTVINDNINNLNAISNNQTTNNNVSNNLNTNDINSMNNNSMNNSTMNSNSIRTDKLNPVITNKDVVSKTVNNSNFANNASNNNEVKTENYNYTFDTFIVGPSNQFAYANCKAITEYRNVVNANPLFIYGPSGLGKTHLLRAIENAMRENHPEKTIISVSSETFTNDIITAISNQQTEEFRNKYRAADILLVDDVQFIAGKESTQVEFFNTFNTLYDAGKQIVLTSDRPPKDIKTLEDRLKTRFEAGMMADVNYPDFETRIAIINKKADELDLKLQPEVSAFIAENLKTHIRQLGGIVKKLQSYQLLTGKIPELSLAQTVIKEVLSNDQPLPITVEKIIDEVAKSHSVKPEDIRSHKRNSNISTARQISFYIIKEITNMPLADIGKEFSDRDHSTITYHIGQVKKKMETDAKLSATIDDIIKNIESK